MTVHTRRAALAVLATAAAATPVLIATRSAMAQTAPAQPADAATYSDYVTQTLTVGSVSLRASQIAAEKATDAMVKEFAQLEVGEQTAVATVLSATGATPPAVPAEDEAKIKSMQDMAAGPEFDAAYVTAQIEGHQKLLQIQQTISGGMDATVEVITAKLAEQGIMSHLAMLTHIQMQMGGATGTSTTAPAESTSTTTTSEAPATSTTTTTEAPATTTTTTAAPDASAGTTTTTAAPAPDATATTTTAPAGGTTATTTTAPAGGATATTTTAPAGGATATTTTAPASGAMATTTTAQ